MSLLTDYSPGTRNHKVWLIPLLIVIVVLFAVNGRKRNGVESEQEQAVDVAAPAADDRPAPARTEAAPRLLEKAESLLREGDLTRARTACREILGQPGSDAIRKAAEKMLGHIHVELVLSRRRMPEKIDYVVKSGDSLGALARRFGTTIEMIKQANGLQTHRIRTGAHLRIFTGTFSLWISKTRNEMVLNMNDEFFKRYPVGTGEYGCTPTGSFHITEKIMDPPWWRPDGKMVPYGDPSNVLGTRWLSLDAPGYGIHGTWEPATIGKQSSAGCIRLLNKDVEELFAMTPKGTAVTIVE